ncbi:hypothetical protein [Acutalibacter muris]|uniref:hypothetical protein n=1 Tax=Acutalibacter muris TaxID=1796620 RepID=UPI001C3EE0C4|nr:hypothetical protein [Acutalibacter muris]
MKLKKVTSLCGKSKCYRLFDKIDSTGEITQWLGDGYAIYPLNGLPILDEESLCAVFDISEKQRENISVRRAAMPESVNTDDTDPAERVLKDDDFSIIYGGTELQPLKTRNGIMLIQRKYLAPLEDVLDMVQLYERVTPDGQSYIAAKTGLLIAAVIFPYNVVNEKFVTRLEEIARECRRVLDAPPRVRPLERDDTQGNLFES